jgi:hypothetical protein
LCPVTPEPEGKPLKKPALRKPSKVERARVRLEAAVTRLERAVATAGPAALAHELQGLREENADLKALTGTVTERLDVAIGRLRSMIGE